MNTNYCFCKKQISLNYFLIREEKIWKQSYVGNQLYIIENELIIYKYSEWVLWFI